MPGLKIVLKLSVESLGIFYKYNRIIFQIQRRIYENVQKVQVCVCGGG